MVPLWSRARKGLLKRRAVQRLAATCGRDPRPERWIFVVGCYNSGTTLLRGLLDRHPEIACLPSEGVRLTDALPRPEDFGWHRMWCRCLDQVRIEPGPSAAARAERVKRQWSWALPAGATNILEKSIANTARLPFLQACFQPAYFIYLMRNGYAVAEGLRRKGEPRRYGHPELGDRYPIWLCAEQWRASDERVEADRPGLERLLLVRYEDLTADPGAVLERITGFLGLAPLPAGAAGDEYEVHGVRSAIRNMNPDSLARLSRVDLDEVNRVAGDVLERRGYERL